MRHRSNLIEPHERNVIRIERLYEIQTNGVDNAYPTRMERILFSSPTAKSCARTMAKFISGNGFKVKFSDDIHVGRIADRLISPNDLLKDFAKSITEQNAIAIHFNYNLNGDKTSIAPLSYKNCRYGMPDDSGYSGKIVYYDNWDYSKPGGIRKKNFDVFDTYNSDKEIIKQQIEFAGGIQFYKGQVLILKFDAGIYPLAPIDGAIEDADSEYNYALHRNRTVKKGFVGKKIIAVEAFDDETEELAFMKDLKDIQGVQSKSDILFFQTKFNSDDKQKVMDIQDLDTNVKTDMYDKWNDIGSNNIRKQFNNVPPVLVDYTDGGIGKASGESIKMAQAFYNGQTAEERATLAKAFKRIFENFYININTTNDWEILQLSLLDDGTNNVINNQGGTAN